MSSASARTSSSSTVTGRGPQLARPPLLELVQRLHSEFRRPELGAPGRQFDDGHAPLLAADLADSHGDRIAHAVVAAALFCLAMLASLAFDLTTRPALTQTLR